MGWLGNFFLIVGTFYINKENRWPFLFLVLGELSWLYESAMIGRNDMIWLCVVFTVLAARNFVKWKKIT